MSGEGSIGERRGKPMLSLGWRLGLVTALGVTLVVGGLTAWRQAKEITRDRARLATLVYDSVGPLLDSLAQAPGPDAVQQEIRSFGLRMSRNSVALWHFEVRDGNEAILASSDASRPFWEPQADHGALQARLPVFSNGLPAGATLLVWREDPSLQEAIALRWRSWLADMLVVILSVIASVAVANHFLVTRPLRRLQDGVRQMGKGYLGALRGLEGPPEFRFLGLSIWRLGRDLEETVRSLVEAERRAWEAVEAPAPGTAATPPQDDSALVATPDGSVTGNAATPLLRRYLLDKVRLLETQDREDPVVQSHAREAWESDIPLAERLADVPLRSRLDDAALRVLDPEAYDLVERYVRSVIGSSPPAWLKAREAEIREVLAAAKVPVVDVERRAKHIAGIWRKMQALDLPVDQVQDILGFRVVVPEVRDCYRALDRLHQRFQPELLSFKDYIARPKPSGYQGLHTHVRASAGPLFEIQIRTAEMHRAADGADGQAAHWRYKIRGRTADAPPLLPGSGLLTRALTALRKGRVDEA